MQDQRANPSLEPSSQPRRDITEMTRGVASPFWAVLRREYGDMLESQRRALESCDAAAVGWHQGWCQALRWVLERPEQIIAALREEAQTQ